MNSSPWVKGIFVRASAHAMKMANGKLTTV